MLRKIKAKLCENRGYVMILVAIALPLFFAAVTYLIKSDKLSHSEALKTATAGAVGTAILKAYDAHKSFNDQKTTLYNAGGKALNDKAYSVFYSMMLSTNNSGVPQQNAQKFSISYNDSTRAITGDLKCINRKVTLYPAECPVDIILTVPTKNSAPTAVVATAYKNFLTTHFSSINWVAAGVIPYSGKISIPTTRANDWTIKIPSCSISTTDEPRLCQAQVYASSGKLGGAITDSSNYAWGYSIMSRFGTNGMGTGIKESNVDNTLLTTAAPSTGNAYKFRRMNLNPCYLGYCNLLGDCCEKACTTYKANPYPIYELTDNISGIATTLGNFAAVSDDFNKSNFLFLPVHWACNLLSTWTAHPGGTNNHPARNKKKKAVILVINAPSNFESKELTYLGFNNDAAVLPMVESDFVDLRNGIKNGIKGVISVDTPNGKIKFSRKGLVKIVVDKIGDGAKIKFSNIKNTNNFVQNDTWYYVTQQRTFYIEPTQITDNNAGDYYIKFNIYNVSFISAEITNRGYKKIWQSNITLNGTTVTSTYHPEKFKIKAKIAETSQITISDSKVGNNGTHTVPIDDTGKELTFDYLTDYKNEKIINNEHNLSFNAAPKKKFSYSLTNAKIKSCFVKERRVRHSGGANGEKGDEGVGVHASHEDGSYKNYYQIKSVGTDRNKRARITYDFRISQLGKPVWSTSSSGGTTVGYLDVHYWTQGLVAAYNPYIYVYDSKDEVTLTKEKGEGWNTKEDIALVDDDYVTFVENNDTHYYGGLAFSRILYVQAKNYKYEVYFDENALSGDISFVGAGKVTLTVQSTLPKPQVKINETGDVFDVPTTGEETEITISADKFTKKKQNSDGLYDYTLSFTLTNAEIVSLEQLTLTTEAIYNKISSAPGHCAYVDFSQQNSSPTNSGFVSCDKKGIEWNSSKKYWTAKNANPTAFKNNNIGCNADAFFLVDFDAVKSVKTSLDSSAYNMGGLWRWFYSSIANNASFSLTINSATPNPPSFIYGGYALPVNTVLYSRYQTSHKINDALNNAAAAACTKLKTMADKIYLIKYNTTDTSLDGCTTSRYSVSNATGLKNALDAIAEDIKAVADYKEPRVTIQITK